MSARPSLPPKASGPTVRQTEPPAPSAPCLHQLGGVLFLSHFHEGLIVSPDVVRSKPPVQEILFQRGTFSFRPKSSLPPRSSSSSSGRTDAENFLPDLRWHCCSRCPPRSPAPKPSLSPPAS